MEGCSHEESVDRDCGRLWELVFFGSLSCGRRLWWELEREMVAKLAAGHWGAN